MVLLGAFVLVLSAGEPDGRDKAADEQDQQHMPKSRGQAAGSDEGGLGLVHDGHDVTIQYYYRSFFFFFLFCHSEHCAGRRQPVMWYRMHTRCRDFFLSIVKRMLEGKQWDMGDCGQVYLEGMGRVALFVALSKPACWIPGYVQHPLIFLFFLFCASMGIGTVCSAGLLQI